MVENYIRQITDSSGTDQNLYESVDTRIFRATCSTAAGTAAKVATLDDNINFPSTLAAGTKVAVTFQYGNTAESPTLNINSSGAKVIAMASGASDRIISNGTTFNTWGDYETVMFTYDGTYWVNEGSSRALYSKTQVQIVRW